MPKSPKNLTLSRQWQMLQLLPMRPPGLTARELTDRLADEGYVVTKRTVERDLNELSLQFGLGNYSPNEKPPFGWYFASGKKTDLGSVALADAVSLVLMSDVIQQIMPPSMSQAIAGKITRAREKLKSLKEHPMSKWSEKVRYVSPVLPLRAPNVKPKIMEAVQEALVTDRQLQLAYASFNERSKDMTVNPLSMVLRGSVPYLLCTVNEYSDICHFALHRIERASILESPVRIPQNYSVDQHIQDGALNFWVGETFQLKAIVTEELAMRLSEMPLHPDQRISFQDDHWELNATVQDSWQFQTWILSLGSGICVQSPQKLRDQIYAKLKESVQRYEDGGER